MAKKRKTEGVDKFVDLLNIPHEETLLISPFSLIITGMTQSGKSTTILNYLKNHKKNFKNDFDQIIYLHGSDTQDKFLEPGLEKVNFTKDQNIIKNIMKTENGVLLIIDDLITELGSDETVQNFFVRDSHHRNVSLIFIVQSAFYQSKEFKICKDNCQYWIIKKHCNIMKLKILAGQCGISHEHFMSAYNYIISKNRFSEMLIDNHIKSELREISPIRYNLLEGGKLLIPDEYFNYNVTNNKIRHLNGNQYSFNNK